MVVLLHDFLELLVCQNTRLFKVGVLFTVSQSTLFFCREAPANPFWPVFSGVWIRNGWARRLGMKRSSFLSLKRYHILAELWVSENSLTSGRVSISLHGCSSLSLKKLCMGCKLWARPILFYTQNCNLRPMNILIFFFSFFVPCFQFLGFLGPVEWFLLNLLGCMWGK